MMKKIERVWHWVLYNYLEKKEKTFTLQQVAQQLDIAISTVHHALRVPVQSGAIRKASRLFVLEDPKKLLYYWASVRNLERDMLARATTPGSVRELEGLALPGSIYAGYSAARFLLPEVPADYSTVYFYLAQEQLPAFIERFGADSATDQPTVVALAMPADMPALGSHTTLIQTFVDIWNLRDWYAREFINTLEIKINGLLS